MWAEHGERPVARNKDLTTVEQGQKEDNDLGEIDPPIDLNLNNVESTVCYKIKI
jgi:hypothetical protein